MIRVRAKQDGTYGGYVWEGPKELENGSFTPGDVFEIDETPYAIKDDAGNPIQEMEPTGQVDDRGNPLFKKAWVTDGNGKLKKDEEGHPIPKVKMASYFSSTWMERVPNDADLTYPERVIPFPILATYRLKQPKQKTVSIPSAMAEAVTNAGSDDKSVI